MRIRKNVLTFALVSALPLVTSAQNLNFDGEDLEPQNIVFNGKDVTASETVGRVTVLLQTQDKTTGMALANCSGTLIAPDVVLTAAHCLVGLNNKEVLGKVTMRIRYNGLNGGFKNAVMKDFVTHPDFSGHASPYDIGLARLSQPIKDRQPVALADAKDFKNGNKLVVAGYGKSHRPQLSEADLLKDAVIARIAQEAIALPTTANYNQKRAELLNQFLARSQQLYDATTPLLKTEMRGQVAPAPNGVFLVIQETHVAVCHGDSGGPSFTNANGRLKVIGVHAVGTGNCDTRKKDGFFQNLFGRSDVLAADAYVPAVKPWIQEKMKKWKSQADI